jgi:hypothetical protein
MYQIAIPLGGLPLQMACLGNGQIGFMRTQDFETIYESCDGYQVCMDYEGIKFTGSKLDTPLDILYNVAINWKDKPVLIEWLQSIQLQMPQFN